MKYRDLADRLGLPHPGNLGLYVLSGHEPVPENDALEWGKWYESHDRHVANDHINGYHISTVFLGIDNRPFSSDPLLFETMVFNDDKHRKSIDTLTVRYATWDEALEGHAQTIQLIVEGTI